MSGPRKKTFGPLLYACSLPGAGGHLRGGRDPGAQAPASGTGTAGSSRTCRAGIPRDALDALGHLELENLASAPALRARALRDPDAKVRVEACRVLANQGVDLDRLITVLSEVVEDESPLVRFEAAACLGKISARVARPSHSRAAVRQGKCPSWGTRAGGSVPLAQGSVERRPRRGGPFPGMAGPADPRPAAAGGGGRRPGSRRALAIAEALLQLNGPDDRHGREAPLRPDRGPGSGCRPPPGPEGPSANQRTTQDRAMGVIAELLPAPTRPSFRT